MFAMYTSISRLYALISYHPLVFVAIIRIVRQQCSVSSTGKILLQPAIALWVDVACRK